MTEAGSVSKMFFPFQNIRWWTEFRNLAILIIIELKYMFYAPDAHFESAAE
jgi:hypothetical protein